MEIFLSECFSLEILPLPDTLLGGMTITLNTIKFLYDINGEMPYDYEKLKNADKTKIKRFYFDGKHIRCLQSGDIIVSFNIKLKCTLSTIPQIPSADFYENTLKILATRISELDDTYLKFLNLKLCENIKSNFTQKQKHFSIYHKLFLDEKEHTECSVVKELTIFKSQTTFQEALKLMDTFGIKENDIYIDHEDKCKGKGKNVSKIIKKRKEIFNSFVNRSVSYEKMCSSGLYLKFVTGYVFSVFLRRLKFMIEELKHYKNLCVKDNRYASKFMTDKEHIEKLFTKSSNNGYIEIYTARLNNGKLRELDVYLKNGNNYYIADEIRLSKNNNDKWSIAYTASKDAKKTTYQEIKNIAEVEMYYDDLDRTSEKILKQKKMMNEICNICK